MSEKANTGAERQRKYAARMRDAGFTRLSLWVPLVRKTEYDNEVIRLQDRWAEEGLYPPKD